MCVYRKQRLQRRRPSPRRMRTHADTQRRRAHVRSTPPRKHRALGAGLALCDRAATQACARTEHPATAKTCTSARAHTPHTHKSVVTSLRRINLDRCSRLAEPPPEVPSPTHTPHAARTHARTHAHDKAHTVAHREWRRYSVGVYPQTV